MAPGLRWQLDSVFLVGKSDSLPFPLAQPWQQRPIAPLVHMKDSRRGAFEGCLDYLGTASFDVAASFDVVAEEIERSRTS
jgi:hypothetical protein